MKKWIRTIVFLDALLLNPGCMNVEVHGDPSQPDLGERFKCYTRIICDGEHEEVETTPCAPHDSLDELVIEESDRVLAEAMLRCKVAAFDVEAEGPVAYCEGRGALTQELCFLD